VGAGAETNAAGLGATRIRHKQILLVNRYSVLKVTGVAIGASVSGAGALDLPLPNKTDSFKFAVIGDFGTGDGPSYEVAAQMAVLRARFPFEIVIMTGDNIIGDQDDPSDLTEKFEPFGPLLDAGVRFCASLGNHDKQANRLYPPFNMNGQRYYTFAKKNVRFFVLDTNRLDRPQLAWVEQALRSSTDDWKICAFHHPLYSDGLKHGPSLELRVMFEPMLVRHGVDAVFLGHDHIYERLKPQKGAQGRRDTRRRRETRSRCSRGQAHC
jgi:hypothetical protein